MKSKHYFAFVADKTCRIVPLGSCADFGEADEKAQAIETTGYVPFIFDLESLKQLYESMKELGYLF